jgi:hypothetical protein
MRLASRIAKLESKHKQVLRCTWCRFALHDTPPSRVKQYAVAPDSVLRTKCWNCGTTYIIPLRDQNKQQREVLDLIHNSHPTKQFVDERIHAALIWSRLYRSEVREYERTRQGQAARASQEPSPAWRDQKAKREYERREHQALEFYSAQFEHFKRLANGPGSFTIDKTIEQLEQTYPSSIYDKAIDDIILSLGFEKYSQPASRLRSALALCNLHLQNLKKREACEIVIWGETLPETTQEIAFLDLEKQRAIEAVVGEGHAV